MRTSKRLSILLVIGLLSMLLSLPVSAQDAATIPAASCDGLSGSLTVQVWDENWASALEGAVAAYKENYCPDANIAIEQVPWAQYWDLLKTDATSGDLPDVFNLSQDQVGFYATNGVLLDLQPTFGESGIEPTVWGSGLVDPYIGANGELFGAPLNWDSIVIYYNKDMFDAAGLDYPTADWTWDDFAADAAALTDADAGVWGASVYNDYQSGWSNWIASAGVPPVANAERTQCTLTEPGSIEALSFLKGLVDQGVMPTISQLGGTNADDAYNLFKSGKLAMYANGQWQLPNAIRDVPFNWDVVQLPKNPTTGESRSTVHAVAWSASATSANPELAANFVQFLSSDDGQQIVAESFGVPPADPNPELLDAWIGSFGETTVNIQSFIDALTNSQGVTTFAEAGDPTTDMIVNIFDLGMSVEDATAQACSEIEPYLNAAS